MNCELCILIVEDDTYVLDNNRDYLRGRGYRTLEAETVAAARKLLAANAVDLALLDINLPDGSGFDLAEEIPGHVPILYLTGRLAEEDAVRGLSRAAGGVDYLRKPYGFAEMGARAAALLNAAAKNRERVKTISRGPLTLDMVAGQAFLNGNNMGLKPKEFALLYLLVSHEGKKFTASDLYLAAWGQDANDDVRTVQVRISGLRKKLETAHGPTVEIELENRKYYRLKYNS